jgi:YesN/AraC family two-component response regulator
MGGEALRLLAAWSIDLVITDILMPDKDGLEVIGELRRRNPEIKVLAYSGGFSRPDFDVLMTAKALGAHATLPKPFSMSEILSAVDHVLALKPS